ncbi:MAG: PEGA domain-containing protein [Ignavibacteriales bacterium]|nr:PEGA domain-containing protein [Ignavibacteriales bacterium]
MKTGSGHFTTSLFLGLSFPFFSVIAQVETTQRAALTINSTPQGAEVFLDNIRVGVTPLVIDSLATGTAKITLTYPDFETWESSLFFERGIPLTLNPQLKAKYGFLSLETSLSRAEIFVDSSLVGTGSLGKMKLPYGWHTVEVSHPEVRAAHSRVYVNPGESVEMASRFGHFTTFPTAYSLVIPGMTQIADGSTTEGAFMFGATAISMYYFLRWNRIYEDRDSKYSFAVLVFEVARGRSPTSPDELGPGYRELYEGIGQANENLNTAIKMALVFYSISLIEGLLFHSTKSSLHVTSRAQEPVLTPKISFQNGKSGVAVELTFDWSWFTTR